MCNFVPLRRHLGRCAIDNGTKKCLSNLKNIQKFCSIQTYFKCRVYQRSSTYRLTPFSIVSNTNVDASCTKVRALALENPEIADDSESEDRRD